jgi:hypothetical protein
LRCEPTPGGRELIRAKLRGYACSIVNGLTRRGHNGMIRRRTNTAVTMKGRSLAAVGAVLLTGLPGLQPASAQDSDSVTVDVGHCVDLESAADRRACFGAQVEGAIEARRTSESDEAPIAVEGGDADQRQAASAKTPARRESPARSRVETRAVDETRTSDAADDEYHGTITSLRERLPNAYVITLDNGQVWTQVQPKRSPLRPGLEVRIYPSKWGSSYRLSGEGTGSFILVRRVR